MQDKESLQDEAFLVRHPEYSVLADVLAAAIANNLLEPRLDSKAKGASWMVLNLNRLLCVSLDLPLGYGGWKEQHLRDLHAWMTSGFKPKQATLL
jgi:hypothetical protein